MKRIIFAVFATMMIGSLTACSGETIVTDEDMAKHIGVEMSNVLDRATSVGRNTKPADRNKEYYMSSMENMCKGMENAFRSSGFNIDKYIGLNAVDTFRLCKGDEPTLTIFKAFGILKPFQNNLGHKGYTMPTTCIELLKLNDNAEVALREIRSARHFGLSDSQFAHATGGS